MRVAGAVKGRGHRRRPAPVEDAAAHRHQVHHRVGELAVVGRDVAPHIAIVAAQRLGAAGHDNVDAVAERRSVERPRGGDRGVEDQADRRRDAAGARHHFPQRVEILGADERIGEGLREHEPRLRPDRRRERRRIAIVDDGDRSANTRGQPLEITAGLVVDLAHQHRVRARLHQHVEGQRGGLHARIADQGRGRLFERPELRDQLGGRGRSVTGVEMRQLGPATLAGKQERGLAFLPLDDLLRAKQVELHRRLVGMQVRHAGPSRVRVDRIVQASRRGAHRGERGSLARARQWIEPIGDPLIPDPLIPDPRSLIPDP